MHDLERENEAMRRFIEAHLLPGERFDLAEWMNSFPDLRTPSF
ncbi:hypothetical protein QET93_007620 [Akkermansia sp. N21116]|nr:hypothetical protein [Akkermansia sp. N21116]WPX39403.1 hypothetical protein QET93_007620 [Akkermansia sp. N21116]